MSRLQKKMAQVVPGPSRNEARVTLVVLCIVVTVVGQELERMLYYRIEEQAAKFVLGLAL
jgi:hypothetical protein